MDKISIQYLMIHCSYYSVWAVVIILYNEYKPEIDSAKKILVDCGVSKLPVMVETIAEQIGIYVLPYSISFEKITQLHLENAASKSDGLSFFVGGASHILQR